MSTDPARVAGERHRRSVATREGVVSCLDTGGPGPTAVFVHGVGTNAHLWRHVLPEVSDLRRCVAVDLPLHGRTPVRPGQDLSLPGLAAVVAAVCEELGAGPVDLVANDTGGAVAQVLASRRPELVASLALTNCEVHDNIPPKAFGPTITLARTGLLARLGPRLLRDPERARARVFGSGYQDVRRLPLDVVTDFLRPVLGTREAGRVFQRLLLALRPGDLVAAEAGLRRLEVPALLVWGTDDPFFAVSWAHRLAATLPGAREPVLVDGGRLFLPTSAPPSSSRPCGRTGVRDIRGMSQRPGCGSLVRGGLARPPTDDGTEGTCRVTTPPPTTPPVRTCTRTRWPR